MTRVLICANPDLNYIDGSSIWSQTIAILLAKAGVNSLHFLTKSKPERMQLFEAFDKHDAIKIIDGTLPGFWAGQAISRLQDHQLTDLAVRLDEKFEYDLVVVRGYNIAKNISGHAALLAKCWVYLTDIPQAVEQLTNECQDILCRIGEGSLRILCQSDGFKAIWRFCAPTAPDNKISLYSPVIPDFPSTVPPVALRANKAIYAGKFKPEWNTLEMAKLWSDISDASPKAELVMIGDKIHHCKKDQSYSKKMQKALEKTKGLEWLGAQSREAVQIEMENAKVGLSWRAESMNKTLEYSTKILEYGRAGCGVVLNRNVLHEQFFGSDYPLFANSDTEFIEKMQLAFSNDEVLNAAAQRIRDVAESHTMSSRLDEVISLLKHDIDFLAQDKRSEKPLTLLVAGHDLKFFNGLKDSLQQLGNYVVIVDQWQGHNKHDETKSFSLLQQADLIFCEWCLGNIQWYSKYKLPGQYLVGRFHLQEKDLPYLASSVLSSIDHVAYVSHQIRREAEEILNLGAEKSSVIANFLDSDNFTINKKVADAKYTLGIMGITPARKRMDRALDLLERLLEKDSRYVLRVKGKFPLDYPWIKNRPAEVEYYIALMERINESDLLRYKVIFDPAGDDVNDWLPLVGYILSPSNFESFHMAVGEGMLTGTTPIIWDWEGAREIWPARYVFSNTDAAAQYIVEHNDDHFDAMESHRQWVLRNYSKEKVATEWLKIFGRMS